MMTHKGRFTMRAQLAIVTIFCFGAIVVGIAMAQGGPGGHPGGHPPQGGPMGGPPDGFDPHVLMQLNLTSDQQTQIHAILAQEQADAKPLHEQLRTLSQQLHTADTFDEATVRANATQQGAIMADLIVIGARAHAAVLNLLTADQKAKLIEMHKHHGPPPPPPPPPPAIQP